MTETPETEWFALQVSRDTRARAQTLGTGRRAHSPTPTQPDGPGWAAFAMTMLFMVAVFQTVDGLVACPPTPSCPSR